MSKDRKQANLTVMSASKIIKCVSVQSEAYMLLLITKAEKEVDSAQR
jgi:hypothetical protein